MNLQEKTKICKTCKEEKPLAEFGKCARCKDGVRGDCRKCLSEKQMARDAPRRDEKIEYLRQWHSDNKDRDRAYRKKYASKRNAARREKYASDEAFRERHKQKVSEWQLKNPRLRKGGRLSKYGITVDRFEEMLNGQDGKCAICGYSDLSVKNFFPVVDHCHKTDEVRGLLCMNCNMGIGKFKDSVEILRNAISYLEKYR